MFAHPDDVDFGAAGTVAGWVDAGIEAGYLLVTWGDAGGFDGYADGTLSPTLALRRGVAAAVRRFGPDRVLTSSPPATWPT